MSKLAVDIMSCPPDPTPKRRRGSGTHWALSGACFWITMHQSDSHHVAYMWLSYDTALYPAIAARESHWCVAMSKWCIHCHDDHMTCCILCAPKCLMCALSSFWGWGLGTRLKINRQLSKLIGKILCILYNIIVSDCQTYYFFINFISM